MPNLDPAALISSGPSMGSINDQMPVEIPPPSPEGDKPINFDAFEQKKSGNPVTKEDITKAPEVLKLDDKAKVDSEMKKEEESALKLQAEKEAAAKKAEEDTKPKPPPTAKAPKATEKVEGDIDFKDYVPETAIPLLKRASKETQEFLVAEFKRNKIALEAAKTEAEVAKKSVKEGLPNAWYEHENAFMLTPEYQGAVQKANTLKGYADHFRQQLIHIKEGEKWVDIVLGPDGKPQQVIKEPGSAADVAVSDRVRSFEDALRYEQQQAGNIAAKFKHQVTTVRADMQKAEDEFFPQYKEAFDKNEHGGYVMKALQEKGQHTNPLAGFLSKLYATFIETNNELEKLQAERDKGKKIAAVNNGPTGEEINKGEKTESNKNIDDQPFDPSAFEKVLNRQR